MKEKKSFQQAVLDYEMGWGEFLPKRLEILAEGFAKKYSSQEVNERLLEQDCEALYARSFLEASLLFAYDRGLTYDRWRTLFEACRKICNEQGAARGIFTGGKITLKQLEAYVFCESEDMLHTRNRTRQMEKELQKKNDGQEFQQFMAENREHFSLVREKTRYYFCKYLYFYIREKCRAYLKSCQAPHKRSQQLALEELVFLKPLTRLKKDGEKASGGMTLEEKKAYLEQTSLTPGGIFNAFNYFYFGYVSTDWVEVLFELYGEFGCWPPQTRMKIARSLSLCSAHADKEEEREALFKLEQMARRQKAREEALDKAYSREEKNRKSLYQRGRTGEDYFRDFILGKKDVNRSTLICFLLFVNAGVSLDEDSRITIPRLNRILVSCGFPQLRPTKEFDCFVMDFLRAKNSVELMEIVEREVEEKVICGKNFYLYQVYREAYCHHDQLVKYLVQPKERREQ